ncbi:MAG: ATP-binding protein, partial [Bacteroidia bacterium]|nr:ATP-binding protein [Bacteroidia bacterium]
MADEIVLASRTAIASSSPQIIDFSYDGYFYEARVFNLDDTDAALIVRDVTNSKKTEIALKEREAQYRAIVEDQTELICRTDSELEIMFVNEAFLRFFKFASYDIPYKINLIKDVLYVSEDIINEIKAVDPQKPMVKFSHRIMVLGKDCRWLEWTARGLFNDLGLIKEYLFVGRDVTELKVFEEQLRQGKEHYMSVVNSVRDVIFQADETGKIVFLNPAWYEMTGNRIENSLNQSFFSYLTENKQQAELLYDLLQSNRADNVRFEARIVCDTSENSKWVEFNLQANHDADGRFIGVTGVIHDINVRKLTEQKLEEAKKEAEAVARSKTDFLAMISHEIRTPMNGVMGMAALLMETELSPEQRELVETIRVSGENLLTIINHILDFSKADSGSFKVENEPFELSYCLDCVLELFAPKAHIKQLDLLYLIEDDVPDWVVGDSNKLRQVLANLIGNAIKFTSSGEVFIHVSCIFRDESSTRLKFTVKDTGPGIGDAEMDKLFLPFVQLETGHRRKHEGTGLGLAISKLLVELMGGEIGAIPGRNGAEFFFIIPLAIHQNKNIISETFSFKDKRIALIEKNFRLRNILIRYLEKYHLTIDSFGSMNEFCPRGF